MRELPLEDTMTDVIISDLDRAVAFACYHGVCTVDAIADAVARARAAGRSEGDTAGYARGIEAAAKVCETEANRVWDDEGDYERGVDDGCVHCSQAIRALVPEVGK